MSEIGVATTSKLVALLGENFVRTDRRERKMYSTDIGTMPGLVAPFIPNGIAGAVVRPQNEQQVIDLIKLAKKERLSLVPRGMSTSGYGGALPTKGSVVVDMSSMNKILSLDAANLRIRVQPGAIWEQVDRDIKKMGITLRTYPSSYRSSTVAGWLAQGGCGFGSYEYGEFKENVISARVVLPTGEVKEFSGDSLSAHIADAEGITGIITEVELKVRELEEETHRLFSFKTIGDLAKTMQDIRNQKIALWSFSFLNPDSIRLKKQLPHRHGHAYQDEHHFEPNIPVSYVAVVAYPTSRTESVAAPLEKIVQAHGGTDLGNEAADHEWEQRFSPMRLKRLGPSIVPTEVIVPLDQLEAVINEIDKKLKQPLIIEGMDLEGDRVILLGFIPHDERSFKFNLAFALALTVIKIAKQHGGSAFSTGLYFRGEAESVLGKEHVRELARYKEKVDPQHLMNPEKVLDKGFVNVMMGAAQALEGVIRPFANAAKPPRKMTDITREVNGIPGDVALMAYSCASCGYCVPTCEQYSGRGWESQSPRGKYHYIREVMAGKEKWDRKAIDTMLLCTTCEVCNERCQLQIPIEHNWTTMRGKLIHEDKNGTFPPFEMMAASLRDEKDIWAAKNEHRADWVPEDVAPKLKESADVLYFAGCTASHVETDIAEATLRLLTDAGHDVCYMGTDEMCCGVPMKMAGKWDLFEEIYVHNTTEARKRGAKTIVTSCPACGLVWKEMYAELARKRGEEYDFEVKHYSELIAPAIADGTIELKRPIEGRVTFHDSCHQGRAQGIYEPPRDMLKAIPGIDYVEMEHNREEGMCCGSVITLIGEISVAPILGGQRLQEAVDQKADKVIALCPCCQVQLRDSNDKNHMGLVIDDLARVVAEAAGYDIPTSDAYSKYMWSYFEKFIILMKPENMAKLMEDVYPQMLNSMPAGMKPMMMGMRHVPGGLDLMEKMMPALFPLLAPSILGKVMPDLIVAVKDYIGIMPDDMDELIPELLPKTMDQLMPTYLPELIPFLVPSFIDYVRKGALGAN
ncbi:MAG: FAD-binding oxidoreductase [Coriobacteriia bacterium]|nr:FAD-binding oxidoreductase [Coriobacteriia bacterium]